ncbi:MAG: exodeoxyribonuclease III [Gammaproteobacteria bacterium]
MRIITLNANGIRSAHKKGFFQWLPRQNADVVCLQETKAHQQQLPPEVASPSRYHAYFRDAKKKGYSGVALYSRREPDRVIGGFGCPEFDDEGRYLRADFGRLSIVSLYLPSGSSSEERQAAKYDFMGKIMPTLKAMRADRRNYIICGDWNIAHKKIDLKNWRGNKKSSGFLPEERGWMDRLFKNVGMVDAFRVVNPEPDQYTWWSNRGQAWAKNVGWRIDYQVVTPGLRRKVRLAKIYKAKRFSDHAPLIMDYDIPF